MFRSSRYFISYSFKYNNYHYYYPFRYYCFNNKIINEINNNNINNVLQLLDQSKDNFNKETLFNSILYLYKNDKIKDASNILNNIKNKDIIDHNFYNSLIKLLGNDNKLDAILDINNIMNNNNILYKYNTYGEVLKALTVTGQLKKTETLLKHMKDKNILLNSYMYNILIGYYCDKYQLIKANNLYLNMIKSKIIPTQSTISCLISSYRHEGKFKEAKLIYNDVEKYNIKPTSTIIDDILKCCKVFDDKLVINIFNTAILYNIKLQKSYFFYWLKVFSEANYIENAMNLCKLTKQSQLTFIDRDFISLFLQLLKNNDTFRIIELLNLIIDISSYPSTTFCNYLLSNSTNIKTSMIIFDWIKTTPIHPDVTTYNKIIRLETNYTKVWDLYIEMEKNNIKGNSLTTTLLLRNNTRLIKDNKTYEDDYDEIIKDNTMLKLCNSIDINESILLLETLHKRNKNINQIPFNICINRLCNTNNINHALILLEKMKEYNIKPDVFTYSTLINGYFNIEKPKLALHTFYNMKSINIEGNYITYATLIHGLIKYPEYHDKCLSIVDEQLCKKITLKTSLIQKLLNIFLDKKDFIKGREFLDKLLHNNININILLLTNFVKTMIDNNNNTNNDILDFIIWIQNNKNISYDKYFYCSIISHLHRNNMLSTAFSIKKLLHKNKLPVSIEIYNCLIEGSCKLDKPIAISKLYSEIEELNIECNIITYNSIIRYFCSKNDIKNANIYYKKALSKQIKPNITTFNIIIKGLFESRNISQAILQLDIIKKYNLQLDSSTLSTYLYELGKMKEFSLGFKILKQLTNEGYKFSLIDCTVFIREICLSIHNFSLICDIIQLMKDNNIERDTLLYNTCINTFLKLGKFNKAFYLVKLMIKDKQKITSVTIGSWITQLCNHNKADLALSLFYLCSELKIKYTLENINALINGLVKSNNILQAYDLLKSIHKYNIKPTARTLTPFIKAYFNNNNIENVRDIINIMIKQNIQGDKILNDLIIREYCSRLKYNEVLEFWNNIIQKNILSKDKINDETIKVLFFYLLNNKYKNDIKNIIQYMEKQGNEYIELLSYFKNKI